MIVDELISISMTLLELNVLNMQSMQCNNINPQLSFHFTAVFSHWIQAMIMQKHFYYYYYLVWITVHVQYIHNNHISEKGGKITATIHSFIHSLTVG